jgi:HlyD family secretion protein
MPLLPQPSSRATSRELTIAERDDPTLPAILEFQSPSTAVITAPVPISARYTTWIVTSMFLACCAAAMLIKVDQVVTAKGVVVSRAANLVVQPLDTAIVRSIDVHPGETVHAGQVLARLDPTFAAADLGALTAQVSSLQAQVARLQAEVDNKPFGYSGLDPNLSLQAAIYAQRQAEYHYKLENYRQKADSLLATIARAKSDAQGYRDRLAVAESVEKMRRELEKLQVGSKLNTLAAMDNRAEMARNFASAQEMITGSTRDLAALIAERDGYVQNWHADAAQQLSDATGKLSDAREQLNKAQLHRQLVELRAEKDGTVLSVAKVSVGSVLQSGQDFITLVPSAAPLEIEANISGADNGYVHVGDPVDIKFDTFDFMQYGMAEGKVRIVSADSFYGSSNTTNQTGAVPIAPGDTNPYYRARITLDEIKLHDTPPGFHLMPGMPVTADVRVGKRSVATYMLDRMLRVPHEGFREP